MRKIIQFIFLSIVFTTISCSVDKDDSGVIDGEVSAPRLALSTAASTATEPGPDNTALMLTWQNGNTSGDIVNTVEMSSDSLFSRFYSQTLNKGASRMNYTFRELNDILLKSLGYKENIQARLYVRVAAVLGDSKAYSNIAGVTVTPGSVLTVPTLTCSTTAVTLTAATPARLALSLSWSKTAKGVKNTLEFSKDSQFLEPYAVAAGDGVYDMQYTYGTLNQLLTGKLGMEADVTDTVYIRVVSTYQTAAAYSNAIGVEATPEATSAAEDDALYVAGFSSADPWNFDDYLVCYNSDYKAYCGVHYAQSKWGYRFYPEKDNWNEYYTMASGGTALSGYLALNGEGNIPAPDDGLYLFDVNLSASNYKLHKVTSVAFAGLNDDWNLETMTPSEGNPTVFSANVTVTRPATYRWQIIFNGDWSLKLCATNGLLLLNNEGASTDTLPNGSYTLSVDLGTSTYTFTPDDRL